MLSQNGIFVPFFNSTERTFVYSALEEASEALRDFYCFSPREWFNYCYDVQTDGEGGINTPNSHAFAEVRQYRPLFESESQKSFDHYQIRLYDRNILRKLWQGSDLEFYPFMVYILTHELIHIARFCQNLHPFDCDPDVLEKEEKKVDRLTREVLKAHKNRCLAGIGGIPRTPIVSLDPARR
jgi:hypothetical protein